MNVTSSDGAEPVTASSQEGSTTDAGPSFSLAGQHRGPGVGKLGLPLEHRKRELGAGNGATEDKEEGRERQPPPPRRRKAESLYY